MIASGIVGKRVVHDILNTGVINVLPQSVSLSTVPAPRVYSARHHGAQSIMSNAHIKAPVRLTLEDFAEREGVPLATVRWWINQGNAPHSYRLGRRRVMDLDDVLSWEANVKAKGSGL